MCDCADLRFAHGAERRERAPQLRLTQAEKKVGLILARIDAFAQNGAVVVMFDDRIMPRGDGIAAKRLGFSAISKWEASSFPYNFTRRLTNSLPRSVKRHG